MNDLIEKSSTIEEQRKQIMKVINNKPTPFQYHPNIDFKSSWYNKQLTVDEITTNYYKSYFTLSDLFIVKAIAEIEVGTKAMIQEVLVNQKNHFPDKAIPNEYDALAGRLKVLAQTSLIKRFQFNTVDEREASVYCVTAHGYNYIKRICNFTKAYDQYYCVTPVDEMVKSLAAINIMLQFKKYPSFIKHTSNMNYYEKSIGRNKLYAEVKTKVDDKVYYVLIDTLYYKHNPARISEEEIKRAMDHRIEVIKSYYTQKGSKGVPIIIFACEDMGGLKKAVQYVLSNLKNYLTRIYFTTDSVVYSNQSIENSLVSLSLQDGKATLTSEIKHDFLGLVNK